MHGLFSPMAQIYALVVSVMSGEASASMFLTSVSSGQASVSDRSASISSLIRSLMVIRVNVVLF